MGDDSDCEIWECDTCKSNRHTVNQYRTYHEALETLKKGAMWDIRGPRYTEVVQVLLHHSADVNAQADNGYSALLWPGRNFQRDMSFWELMLPSTAKPKRIIVWWSFWRSKHSELWCDSPDCMLQVCSWNTTQGLSILNSLNLQAAFVVNVSLGVSSGRSRLPNWGFLAEAWIGGLGAFGTNFSGISNPTFRQETVRILLDSATLAA